MSERAQLWEMRVSSWVGVAYNAEHYYVELRADEYEATDKPGVWRLHSTSVRVEHLISEEYAAELTHKDSVRWSAGTPTSRFKTRDDAVRAGLLAWRRVGQPEDALTFGHDHDSVPVLVDGPDEFSSEYAALTGDRYSGWCDLVIRYGYEQRGATVSGHGSRYDSRTEVVAL